MAEKKYAKGLWYNLPPERAPKWVLGRLSIKKVDFIEWLKIQEQNEKGYINIDILNSKEGKPYCALNEYKRQSTAQEDRDYDRKFDNEMTEEGVPPLGADQVPF